MDSEAIDFAKIRELLDVLYDNRNTPISDLPDDVKEIHETMKIIMGILEKNNTRDYDVVIKMIKEYDDKQFLPNTLGEYLFDCITMTNTDKCVKDCNRSIKESANQFSKCAYPVYKVGQYGSIELIYNENLLNPLNPNDRTTTAVVLVDPNQGLTNDAVIVLKDAGFKELHLYNRGNNRYIGKYTLNNGTYRPVLPTDGEDPIDSVAKGKKGKAPKGKKGKNGKQDYWKVVGIIVGGILVVGLVYFIMNNKKNKGSSDNNDNSNRQTPLYQTPRPTKKGTRCFQQ